MTGRARLRIGCVKCHICWLEIHSLLIFPNYLKLAAFEFSCQQNRGTYEENKNKSDGCFKAISFEIQNIIFGEIKKKSKQNLTTLEKYITFTCKDLFRKNIIPKCMQPTDVKQSTDLLLHPYR